MLKAGVCSYYSRNDSADRLLAAIATIAFDATFFPWLKWRKLMGVGGGQTV